MQNSIRRTILRSAIGSAALLIAAALSDLALARVEAAEGPQLALYVMNADGKGRHWLFAGRAPSFSPDGSRILFVSSHEGSQSIYVHDVLESTSKKILQEPYQKQPGSASWSADGKRVAFVDERSGKSE